MKIFHHNDIDGRCAAAIVKKAIDEGRLVDVLHPEPEFFEMDYKTEIPVATIALDEAVVIVDFSFEPKDMNLVLKMTQQIVWIDHHKTAKTYLDEYDCEVKGLQDFTTPGKSGAELAWEYFFPNSPMPRAVKLVGDHDTWRWEHGEETASFHEGLGLEDQSPSSDMWRTLLYEAVYNMETSRIKEILRNGEISIRYRNNFCLDYCRTYGFETKFEGYKCYALNLYRFGSIGFGEKIDFYDICISFAFDGAKYSVGLYTKRKDLDLGAIAKKHGGGGHQQAAGFVCTTLPNFLKRA